MRLFSCLGSFLICLRQMMLLTHQTASMRFPTGLVMTR